MSICYVSGTMGAGGFYHTANATSTQTAPSSGTLLTTWSTDIGNGAAGVGIARIGATVVAPHTIRPFASSFPELATTAASFQIIVEDLLGEIVIDAS